ncbi:MAG TPA: hypothetical protein VN923_14690 [Thermoanaerobaculia bacterium]|nr:hypothetical protein [Thermoanaerobaculia bacterium]
MSKLTMHWRVGDAADPGAHFFLYREGEEVHCDHRLYSRDELERRVAGILSASGEVPRYYIAALMAFEDPRAPRSGAVAVSAAPPADLPTPQA